MTTTHEFDLASWPVHTAEVPGAPGRPGIGRGIALLAMGLAGIGLGAVLAAAPSGGSDAPPVSATLAPLDITVTGQHAITKLRLTVDNPGAEAIRATALTLDGVTANRIRVPLNAVLQPGGHQIVDVSVDAACERPGTSSDDQHPFRIHLLMAGRSAGVPVLPASMLDRNGGLCTLLDSVLPHGWDSPVRTASVRPDGPDLVLSVPALKGQDVAGSDPTAGVVNTSAYVGDRLVSATLTSGTTLRLIGPAPCITGSNGDPIPMTVRVLAHVSFGLRQLLIQAGPDAARWVSQDCHD